jgi:predicted DNA-binding transcriptional regulator AlpA
VASAKPIQISGNSYFPALAVAEAAGISRTTLWRWRQDRKIPSGHLYRGRQVIFTAEELEEVKQYANRIEPIVGGASQLRLFNGSITEVKR